MVATTGFAAPKWSFSIAERAPLVALGAAELAAQPLLRPEHDERGRDRRIIGAERLLSNAHGVLQQ